MFAIYKKQLAVNKSQYRSQPLRMASGSQASDAEIQDLNALDPAQHARDEAERQRDEIARLQQQIQAFEVNIRSYQYEGCDPSTKEGLQNYINILYHKNQIHLLRIEIAKASSQIFEDSEIRNIKKVASKLTKSKQVLYI